MAPVSRSLIFMHHNPVVLGAVQTEKENIIPAARAGNPNRSQRVQMSGEEGKERPHEEADSIISC